MTMLRPISDGTTQLFRVVVPASPDTAWDKTDDVIADDSDYLGLRPEGAGISISDMNLTAADAPSEEATVTLHVRHRGTTALVSTITVGSVGDTNDNVILSDSTDDEWLDEEFELSSSAWSTWDWSVVRVVVQAIGGTATNYDVSQLYVKITEPFTPPVRATIDSIINSRQVDSVILSDEETESIISS